MEYKIKLVIEKEMIALYLWNQFKYREYGKFIKKMAKMHSVFTRTFNIEKHHKESDEFTLKMASQETDSLWKLTCNKDIMTDFITRKYKLEKKEHHSFHNFYVNTITGQEYILPDEFDVNTITGQEYILPDEFDVKKVINILQSEFLANIAIFSDDNLKEDFKQEILKFANFLNPETISIYEAGKIINAIDQDKNKVINTEVNRRRL